MDSLLLESGIIGLKEDFCTNNRKQFYENCRRHFLQNKTEFTDERRSSFLHHWLTEDYETGWIKLIDDFDAQLENKKEELKKSGSPLKGDLSRL